MTDVAPALMILIAGPYRSGTNDDPAKLAANVMAVGPFALPLFRADQMITVAKERGLAVFYHLNEVPGCQDLAT